MDERIVEDLVGLGLSRYEARAYVSLFRRGPETAERIATAAEVPKGRIYDVLNSLSERSLVRSDEGRPKTYSAVESTQAVDRLLETRIGELDERRTGYERTADALKRSLASLEPDENDTGFSTSAFHHDAALDLLVDRFEAAEDSILIAADEATDRSEADDEIADLLRRQLAEGVEVRLLVAETIEWDENVDGKEFEVRITDPEQQPDHRFIVIDGTEACIEVVRPASPDELLAVVNFRNNQPVWDLTETFESLWRTATPATGRET